MTGAAPLEVAAGRQQHDRLDLFAIALLTLLCVFLGVGQVAMKVANSGISPLMQAGLRSAGAAVLLAAWCRWRGIALLKRDRMLYPGLLAGLFFTAEFAFLYPGLERTTASRAVILLYTSPFVVAIGAHWLIPGDRLTLAKLSGLALALLGIALVMSQRSPGGEATLVGDLLCLAGAVAWGCITLTVRATRLKQAAPERVTMIQLVVSAGLLLALSALLGERGVFDPNPKVLVAFTWTVVFVGFITFTTSFWLLSIYPASRVMAFLMLTPIFGVAAGAFLLGEPLTWHLLAGLFLVLAGLWLVNRPPAR